MSDATAASAGPRSAGARPGAGLPWSLWLRQGLAILRLEMKKSFLGRRAIGLYLLALAPVVVLALRAVVPHGGSADLAEATTIYANVYQDFLLRVVIFLGAVGVFGNLIRREILDRSLHYYFLAPLRREILVVAKFATGVVVTVTLFGLSTAASFFLAYAPAQAGTLEPFLLRGPGLGHLGSYLLVSTLACIGYGAVFLACGFFWKSPAVPALLFFGWEGIHFLLPPLLKQVSVIHYLQSLCPVPISEGPFATLSDAPGTATSILGLLALALVLLAISAWRIRQMEISYEDD
jgi:ABC-type transport system involved in multi-copper enzyme maturation permease subunit